MSSTASNQAARLQYLDWLRGVAVLIMIMWHAIDSWHVRDDRTTPVFVAITFLAGWAAPLFLFLAGVSLALAGESRLARGLSRREVARSLARRGWEVFLIAHLFRLQSFVLNVNASWSGLIKPDILNIMGLGLVAAASLWRRASDERSQITFLLVPAVVVALVLTPWAPTWWWPSLLHPRLEAYIRPVGNYGVFSLFPAVAFLWAGAYAGVRLASRTESVFHRGAVTVGAALLVVGIGVDAGTTVRWIQPAAVVAWRVGAMLLLLSGARQLLAARTLSDVDPLIVFGKTSLFVYWIHVELAYGAASLPLWKNLTLPWAVAAYLVLTLAMYGAARWWLRRPAGPLIPAHMKAVPSGAVR